MRAYLRHCLVIALPSLLLVNTVAHASGPQPLWELGAGAGILDFPPYAGSQHQTLQAIPVPYFVYRGKHIRADRSGIRGILIDTDTLALRLSLSATPPPDDDGVAVREGMPGLDPAFEFGPELRWRLWAANDTDLQVHLRLPVRSAFTASSEGLESIGWVSTPALNLELHDLPASGWRIGMNLGPVFGSSDYHAYYYGVDARYVTAARPAYDAEAGYGGMQWTGSVTRRRGNLWIGAFLRAQSLHGAEFEDSPLVQSDTALAGGIAFAWIFARSERQVRLDSEE